MMVKKMVKCTRNRKAIIFCIGKKKKKKKKNEMEKLKRKFSSSVEKWFYSANYPLRMLRLFAMGRLHAWLRLSMKKHPEVYSS